MAFRVDHERGEVVGPVVGAEARWTIVLTAGGKCSRMERGNRGATGGGQSDVKPWDVGDGLPHLLDGEQVIGARRAVTNGLFIFSGPKI